jgi:thymidylate synthase (FAD)
MKTRRDRSVNDKIDVISRQNLRVELLSLTEKAEELIEVAGRISHRSQKRRKGDSKEDFIRMLIRMGHESVLEHASATFRISGVSRALTHQLVRHRICSYTQSSQRYVNQEIFNFIEPKGIMKNEDGNRIFLRSMKQSRETYIELQKLGITNEDARFVLPTAIETEIVMTANLREWRHVIELRGKREAQWEIRMMAIEILRILKKRVPVVFEDFIIDQEGQIVKKVRL